MATTLDLSEPRHELDSLSVRNAILYNTSACVYVYTTTNYFDAIFADAQSIIDLTG